MRRPISMDHLYPIKNLRQTVGRERKFEEIKQKVQKRKKIKRHSASVHGTRSRQPILVTSILEHASQSKMENHPP